jgi:hypothetical protein
MKRLIEGPVHRPHATAPNTVEHPIFAYVLTDHVENPAAHAGSPEV